MSFDWKFYTSYYPDLNFLDTEKKAIEHYDLHGKFEKRITNMGNFDWKFYTSYHEDLRHIDNSALAYMHYMNFGKLEMRIPNKECLDNINNTKRILDRKFDEFYNMLDNDERLTLENNAEYFNTHLISKSNIYYFIGSICQLPLYISLIKESNTRGYRNIVIVRNHIKPRYDIKNDYKELTTHSKLYNFFIVHNKYINLKNLRGIVFIADGDILGPPRVNELSSSMLLSVHHLNVVRVSLALDFNFWATYKHFIDKVDYANFFCKDFVEQVKTFNNSYFDGIVDLSDKSIFDSSKNIYLGNTKFDNLKNKEEIYLKYKLNKDLKYCVFLFPKILNYLKKENFLNFYSILRDNGFTIIVKTRPKDKCQFDNLNDDGLLCGDIYVNSESFPNETLELMKISELCVISSSSAANEAIYCKVPIIDIESDLRPNYITRNNFLLDTNINKQYDIETWTNWTTDEFRNILNTLKRKDDEYFNKIFDKYYTNVDTSVKLLNFIENTEKYKKLFHD